MDRKSDNQQLAERVRGGDLEALAELFALHRPRLWRIVQFRLNGPLAGRVDPDDVLQEAYLAAARRIGHYSQMSTSPIVIDGEGSGRDGLPSPFVWLRLIVQQTLIDIHRRHVGAQMRDAGREVSIFAGQASNTSASMAIHLVGGGTSPSMAAARGETFATIEKAIESMDPVDREVLALRHFEELTNAEVAEVLGIAVKAASIRYVRALRRLQQLLGTAPASSEDAGHAS